ncbi:MAG TPA: hypothetical protein VLT33_19175 [Labilithrix sp.]|nr:hypothetical protein [Labilithrix sp.]
MSNRRRRLLPWSALAVVVGTVTLFACGGSVASTGCVPGAQTACACPGGSTGVQVCLSTQTYDRCSCSGTLPGDPGDPGYPGSPSFPPPPSSSEPGVDASVTIPEDGSACAGSGNVLVLNGDSGDYIHPGYARITVAQWQPAASGPRDTVSFSIEPSGQQFGSWWNVELSTARLSVPLAVGTYQGAERAPFASFMKPGLDVSGDGRGCNTLSGKFSIHEISWDGDILVHVLASFEQHCEQGQAALRGCVKFDQPKDAGP